MSISVILPTYNRAAYLAETIESVLQQTYQDLELIVIDDASTDGTRELLERLQKKDRRLKVVHQTENKGGARGRNLALSIASHDLVACMDDDDIMLPSRLKTQFDFMQKNPDVSVVSSAAHMIDGNGKIIGKSIPTIDIDRGKREYNPEFFVNLIHPTTMYRKKDVLDVGGYKDLLLDDRELWGRMVTSGYKLAVSPDVVLWHRRHSSIMTTRIATLFELGSFIDFNIVRRLRGQSDVSIEFYREFLSSLPFLQRLAFKKRRNAAIKFRLATLYFSNKQWRQFLISVTTAIALEPVKYIKVILLKRKDVPLGRRAARMAAV